jgi:hypothetical protein
VLDVEGGAKRVERMFASCGPLAEAKEPISELFSIIGQVVRMRIGQTRSRSRRNRRALAAGFALKMRMKTHRVARSMATKR